LGQVAVKLDFLDRAAAAFQTEVVGQVDVPHAALANPLADSVSLTQHRPGC
jgi:hypothetical protein